MCGGGAAFFTHPLLDLSFELEQKVADLRTEIQREEIESKKIELAIKEAELKLRKADDERLPMTVRQCGMNY